jgi:lambda family phage portal protein
LIARAIINRLRTNVIGRGLRLRSKISGPQFDSADPDTISATETLIEGHFRAWADSPDECDIEGHQTFSYLQSAVFQSALLSGDCFVYIKSDPGKIYGTTLQIIEADRVSTPLNRQNQSNIFDGIEKDASGRTVAIHVAGSYPQDQAQPSWTRVPVFDSMGREQILQVFGDRDRPGAPRGAPFLAPILESLFRIEQYINAELTATAINSMLTLFIERDLQPGMDLEMPQDIEASNIKLGNGAIIDLAPGERINLADPKRPVPGFGDFLTSMVRQIGAALEIPGDELMMHFDSSYSAARASMLKAWQAYLVRRESFANHMCSKVYRYWLDNVVSLGIIDLPGYFDDAQRRNAYGSARWIGPARGAVDELKEAQAAQLRMNIGVSSLARESAAMSGDDWEVIHNELVAEQRRKAQDGLQSVDGGSPGVSVGD